MITIIVNMMVVINVNLAVNQVALGAVIKDVKNVIRKGGI
jgi:hypothetical protein